MKLRALPLFLILALLLGACGSASKETDLVAFVIHRMLADIPPSDVVFYEVKLDTGRIEETLLQESLAKLGGVLPRLIPLPSSGQDLPPETPIGSENHLLRVEIVAWTGLKEAQVDITLQSGPASARGGSMLVLRGKKGWEHKETLSNWTN